MPRRDVNKPVPTRSKKFVPVVLQTNYRGRNSGETHGFRPADATALVNGRAARFLDDEARKMAERAGFAAKADVEHAVDGEVAERAEQHARKIVDEMRAEMEEKMTDIVAANKEGSAVVTEMRAEIDDVRQDLVAATDIAEAQSTAILAKDEEIAKLKADLTKAKGKGGK